MFNNHHQPAPDQHLAGPLATEGYALLRGSVPLSAIAKLYRGLVMLLRKYDASLSNAEYEALLKEEPFTGVLLNQRLINLRRDDSKMFGMIYDSIQLSVPMHRLCCEAPLLEAVGAAWGVDPEGIAVTGHMLRMDPPNDTRNSLDWHQDSTYYDQNQRGENGLVVWIPMHFVDAQNGSLLVCPGSHKEGQVEYVMSDPTDVSASRQRRVPPEIVDRYSPTQVTANAGDALILNMDTVHRSGVNSGSKLRFVAGYRYHKMLTDDFLPGKMRFHPNQTVGRLGDYRKLNAVPAH
jgi:hypothetical protein